MNTTILSYRVRVPTFQAVCGSCPWRGNVWTTNTHASREAMAHEVEHEQWQAAARPARAGEGEGQG